MSTCTDKILNLMDSGNPLVYDNVTTLTSLWQSFENPTDTFLPNTSMDENLKLTSWTDHHDPGSGNFLFMLEQLGSSSNH